MRFLFYIYSAVLVSPVITTVYSRTHWLQTHRSLHVLPATSASLSLPAAFSLPECRFNAASKPAIRPTSNKKSRSGISKTLFFFYFAEIFPRYVSSTENYGLVFHGDDLIDTTRWRQRPTNVVVLQNISWAATLTLHR